jgi:parallel beta-helix repeat protein
VLYAFLRRTAASPWPALCLLLVGSCLLAGPARTAGAVYYVSPAGSDSAAGTQAAPFRQIRRAVQVAAAGDTILVADGDYLGFDMWPKHGQAGAPITIRALGTAARVWPTSDRPDNRDTILVMHSSWIVIDGLRSFQANRAAVRVSQSQRITIRNGVFGNNGVWGIFTDFSDDLLIERNECYGSVKEHGIYVSNSGDRPVVRDNYVHDNHASGIQLNADATVGGDGIITGALVENNVIHGNGLGGGAAINLDGIQDSVIRNNLIFNNLATGIANYRINGAAGPKGMQILHNTIDQPADGRWALMFSSTTGHNLARNNILIHRGSWRGGILFGGWVDVANTDSRFNILDRVTPDNGGSSIPLSQWQGQGYEAGSFSATPASLWVNPTGGDYHLLSTAPAVDRGESLASVTRDLEGNVRPSGAAWDIGCYERASSAPPPADTTPPGAPTGLHATAGDGQVALGWNANTEPDLAGYNVYRSTSQTGSYTKQNSSILTLTALTQTGLVNGTTYWYRVSALDKSGNESPQSAAVSATPQAAVYGIGGRITLYGSGLAGATVTAGGTSATTGADGTYNLGGLPAGTYTVTASLSGYTFSPASQSVTVGPSKTGVDFQAAAAAQGPVVSGQVLGDFAGTQVRLASTATPWQQTVTVDAQGRFSFTGWSPGFYDLRCLPQPGVTYSPVSMSIGVTSAGRTDLVFRATGAATAYTISGKVTAAGAPLAGVTLNAGGKTATTAVDGTYSLAGLAAGTYVVTPSLTGYTFSPVSQTVTVGPSASGVDFTASAPATYAVAGKATLDGSALSGVTVSGGGKTATTAADGTYNLNGLPAGTYTVTASLSGYTFSPASQSVTVGPSKTGVDFQAAAAAQGPVVSGQVLGDFPGTQVRLASTATPWQQTVTVDAQGRFRFTGWSPGFYDLRCLPQPGVTYSPVSMSIGVTSAGRTDLVFRASRVQ